MSLQWTEDLATGNSEIDAQHKALFATVDALLVAIEHGRGRQEVASTLNYLEGYLNFHIIAEERLMTEHAYPGIETHRAAHVQFTDDLANWKRRYEADGPSPAFDMVLDLQLRLGGWLRDHVSKADRDLARFLKSKS